MPKESNLFFLKKHMTLRIELFLPIWLTPRIQAFWTFSYDSKNWTLFLEYDSKIWTGLKMTQRIELCLKMTQRIEPFSSKWLKNFVLWIRLRIVFLIMTLRMVLFCVLWLLWLNLFDNTTQRDWTFFDLLWPKGLCFLIWVTESNTFWTRLKELNTPEYDSKNWTTLSQNDSKTWTFFGIWLNGLNFFSIWLKELNLFCHLKELNLLLLLFHDAKNWTPFSETQLNTFLIQRIEHSFWTRLTELNSFFWNVTQRIEPSTMDWYLEVKIWAEDRQYSSCP